MLFPSFLTCLTCPLDQHTTHRGLDHPPSNIIPQLGVCIPVSEPMQPAQLTTVVHIQTQASWLICIPAKQGIPAQDFGT
jgi:hypothetical protein